MNIEKLLVKVKKSGVESKENIVGYQPSSIKVSGDCVCSGTRIKRELKSINECNNYSDCACLQI